MHCKGPGLAETFTAFKAFERFLLGVDVPVMRKVWLEIDHLFYF